MSITASEDEDREYNPYPLDADPQKMMAVFRSLVLFDELFLHMQVMNVVIVDQYLIPLEHDLLREYLEIERTPVQSATLVRAFSQMWIFSVYELLRTWRQRVGELIEIADGKKAPPQTTAQPLDEMNLNKHFQERAIQKAVDTPGYGDVLRQHREVMKPVFRRCEAIRIILAKHETAQHGKFLPPSPGYARINMLCGAMDFMVLAADGSFDSINRRDIAEAIRQIDTSLLPKA